jgi:hypothetical protein
MTSRTPEGKHTKRFIVLKKNSMDEKYVRSLNLPQAFETKELAQTALAIHALKFPKVQYKIRQK